MTSAMFKAHMCTHFEHPCPHCDYTSRTEGRLKKHIRDFHSDDNDGHHREPTRPKILRCRQCDFSSEDKLDFWQHAREHIKMDKALHCPSCPFVTEYKHHLEYHLRNHFGSKPYQCPKCNYACVNKSMLNSHMKSHTNVYQYRCMDCSYATKYSHSLKLHLHKYSHRPAVILKPDGSLPVDGSSSLESATKRGPPKGSPKRRKRRTGKKSPSAGVCGSSRSLSTATVSSVPILVATTPTIMLSHSAGDSGLAKPIVPLTLPNHQPSLHYVTPQQQPDQENGDPVDDVQPTITKQVTSIKRNGEQSDGRDKLLHSKSLPAALNEDEMDVDMCPLLTLNKTFVSLGAEKPIDLTKRVDYMEYILDCIEEDTALKNLGIKLSFNCIEGIDNQNATSTRSKPKKIFQSEPIKLQQQCSILNMPSRVLQDVTSSTEESRFSSREMTNLPHATTCRICLENDDSNNQLLTDQHQIELSTIVDVTLNVKRENLCEQQRMLPRENGSNTNGTDVKYECSHCQIEFRDYVMYMMHKGYHGYQDPLTCNMCGFHADGRLEFFLHIARVAHE